MNENPFVIRVVVVTLAAILFVVICAMLYGLFDSRVDNAEVFKILGPAFQTVTGCFVGVLGSQVLGKKP